MQAEESAEDADALVERIHQLASATSQTSSNSARLSDEVSELALELRRLKEAAGQFAERLRS
jgi:methyl-accepting chemotaxis protein